jgi:hypothetical protein
VRTDDCALVLRGSSSARPARLIASHDAPLLPAMTISSVKDGGEESAGSVGEYLGERV